MSEIIFPNNKFIFKICIITGMCRVGKTLLGNIISTSPEVEYAEEPWPLQYIPIIADKLNLNNNLLSSMYCSYINELYKDFFLLRCANFRPKDLSYIGRKKTQKEIYYRLNFLHNLNDVQLESQKKIFVLNLSETCYALGFLINTLLESELKIIYITRHPFSVAKDIYLKNWLSDRVLTSPAMNTPYKKKYKSIYIPFWVPDGDEKFFYNLDVMDRGIYYWCIMTEKSHQFLNDTMRIFKYEEITQHALSVWNDVSEFLSLSTGDLTYNEINKVHKSIIHEYNILNKDLYSICMSTINKYDYGYLL